MNLRITRCCETSLILSSHHLVTLHSRKADLGLPDSRRMKAAHTAQRNSSCIHGGPAARTSRPPRNSEPRAAFIRWPPNEKDGLYSIHASLSALITRIIPTVAMTVVFGTTRRKGRSHAIGTSRSTVATATIVSTWQPVCGLQRFRAF